MGLQTHDKKGVQWGRRVLTGLVGIPSALKMLSTDLGMLVLATTLCCLSLVEFTATICPQIVPESKVALEKLVRRLVVVGTGALVCVAAWSGNKSIHDAVAVGATLAVFTYHILATKKLDQPALLTLLLDLFALVYIVNGFSHAILLRYSSVKYGLGLQILGLSCAWVCDSGALVAGSFMGHAKLAPVVSPGKTLVGAVAGILSSVATVIAMCALPRCSNALSSVPIFAQWTHELLPPLELMPLTHQVILGLVLGVLCILGDLVESYVKRVAGVKDSGAFFPGHGGCLDRMDSFLFVAPCLYFYSRFALE
ncbi:hypothetical protein BBJ28_00001382 [Nothophytophthora sp. Chile5]|nr:hypothetical protein BBJ28_00001382 [Nothophytophthora sp. Chile5]